MKIVLALCVLVVALAGCRDDRGFTKSVFEKHERWGGGSTTE